MPKNYWLCGLIEPNIRGGSEVRKVFMDSLLNIQSRKQNGN